MKLSEQEEVITSQNQHITKMEEAVQHAEWDVNNYVSALQARYGLRVPCFSSSVSRVFH